jgi:hypothetical protein
MFLYFLNNLMLKIEVHVNVSERCFLWFKFDRGSLAYSLVKLWCIKRNADDQNIDMILVMLLDNIFMGITS